MIIIKSMKLEEQLFFDNSIFWSSLFSKNWAWFLPATLWVFGKKYENKLKSNFDQCRLFGFEYGIWKSNLKLSNE